MDTLRHNADTDLKQCKHYEDVAYWTRYCELSVADGHFVLVCLKKKKKAVLGLAEYPLKSHSWLWLIHL